MPVCMSPRRNFVAKPKNKDHFSCPPSLASRLLSEFFRVPGPLYRGITMYSEHLASLDALVFQVPVSIWREAWNFSKSQSHYIGRKLYTTIRISLRSSKSQSLLWGKARNFCKFQDLCIGRKLCTTTRTSLARCLALLSSEPISELACFMSVFPVTPPPKIIEIKRKYNQIMK